jgi:hypothetical protein
MNLEQAGRSGATVHIMSLSIVIFVPEFTTLKDIRARLAGSYSLGEDEGLGEVEELNVGHHDGRPICVIEYPIETLNGILQRRGIDASQLRGFWLHQANRHAQQLGGHNDGEVHNGAGVHRDGGIGSGLESVWLVESEG